VASLLAPAASAAATAASASTPRVLLPPPEPVLRVSGVFTSPQRAVAEVVVDGAVFLLAAGQAVPGTGWHVASITPERVTLARPTEPRESGHPVPAQRTFQLASAR
jgi:type IV pilus biogenesis protein PilP